MSKLKIIEKVINKNIDIHSNLKDKKICFLDIETTGFSRNSDSIYLIGLVYFDTSIKSWKIIQLFAEELKEEIDLLYESYKILSNFDLIINYNGTSFDIPFINSKLSFYRTNLSIDLDKSLDLYKIIQANKNIFQLENYKLKTIEEFLGIYRDDKFTGRDCIDFYIDYLVTKNEESKDNILLHNYEDLYYLLDVIRIIDILEDKKSFTIKYNNNKNYFLIDNISLNKDYLFIKGNIDNNNIINTIHFGDNYKIIISKDNTFEISLEVREAMVTPTKKCIFVGANTYDLPIRSYWNNEFQIAKGLILLSVEKNYYIENIKLISSHLINKILR